MCCTRLAENTAPKSRQKSPSGHHRTNFPAISSQLRHISTIGKKLVKQHSNVFSICLHNIANFGRLTAEIISLFWGTPANFNGFRVLPSLLKRRRSPEANQTLHDAWPSPGLVHYIYTFGGYCHLMEFCQVQNSLYVQVLRSPILEALHGTPAAGVSQTLWRGTRNGITELSQRVPSIFGRAAITLGIGPHSGLYIIYLGNRFFGPSRPACALCLVKQL